MFGKNNEETVGLLKVSANKLDGNTKYGTVENNVKKKPTVSGLFRYASKGDVVLMSIGIICSVIHGSSFPVLALVFGQMTNVFIKQASVTSTVNNSMVNIPLTVVGNALDLIHTNPFNSTSNYTNILRSSDVSTNSPLNEESSTFGAFFMSEMERMSTVRTITEIDVRKTTDVPNQFSDDTLSPEEFYNDMTKFSLYYLYIGCTVLIAAFIQTFCWEITCERQIYQLRKVFYCQILRQEISWYDLSDGEDLTTKLSDDLERVREGIGSKFSMVTQYVSTLFTGIVIGLFVDWRLTSIILCVTPFLVSVSGALAIVSASTAAREQMKYDLAGGIAKEVLLNIQTVAAFGGELRESKKYELAIEGGRKLVMKKYYVFSILMGSVFVIMYSAYGIAFWYGSNLIVDGISSPGSIFTVFFSVMAGAFSVGNALPFINSVCIAIGAASNVFDIIDSTPNIDPYSSQGKKINKIQGKIEFKNVNFAYPTRYSIPVLNNLSLTIEPGQTVALVGSSGGGKSTVGSLLLRFYDPTEGQVLLDDFDLKYLNLHWLRQNIGVVSQEPVLFNVSIAENIRYGQTDSTRQDIIAAAMSANAHSFIIKLPKGYDTLVGDKGSQLSGGQKQRIAIARALVKDPKILLLDEATSVLDAQSEGIVQEALDKAQQDRSTIIIAHRLSTIRNVDVIFVLQNGSIVESGTHDFLISKNGLYSNLFNTQVKRENNEISGDSLESDEDIINNKNINTEYATPSTSQFQNKQINFKNPEFESYGGVDDVANENIEDQAIIDSNNTEITTKKVSVLEKCIEPEKVFTDSFITEDSDGRKVNVTRKISSRKVKRIIYLEQGSTDSELETYDYRPSSLRGSTSIRPMSQPDDYSQWETSDIELNRNTEFAMISKNGYQYNKKNIMPEIENFCMKDILKFNRPEWPWLMMGFIGCALTGIIMPVFAIFYGQVFATFTLKGDELLQEAAFWSKMFIILALLSGLAWWMQTFGFTYACEKLIMRMRVYAFKNVLRQPIFWFDFKSSSPSNIISRLARETPLVKSAGSLRVAQVISAFVTLSAALIIAFTFGWKFAVVLVIGVPIIAGAAYKQLMIVQRSQKQDLECMDEAARIKSETISSIKTVQGLAQELMFVSKYKNSLNDPFKTAKKRAFSFAIMYAVSQAVIYGMYSVSFRYGAFLVEIGDMSATDIYRVFFALAFCAASIGQTSAYLQDYSRAKIAASLIFKLIRRKSEIDPLSNTGSKPTIKGKVHFKDVKFEYPSRPNVRVLQGLNLIVEPGKTLAIVGESGCGKSTILYLLERFYDPSTGVIEVDNHDIRLMNLCHLRQNIGIVTQEPILFNSSIKDNIAYGVSNREVPMDEIIDAAKKANIHNFITTLAQRYDTLAGDQGSQLSEGQKQRVAIARALIRNPKILLLDEATKALDTENEVLVQGALEAACKGRTCIIIAYRLSTIQLADSIAVVHNGKIVEQGNHEELKAKKKYYYELITRQEESSNQLQL
ncbi:ATP-dependent translocase ABCB1-like [Metopolophium dirhodum]|uniref:ATP-dependent translocase ABCB1-like n=1 Tax=Metopolophium dirhodum TaxID=44670 RepID=UPI00298FB184|nr:ATP-dependent translocase ABCB1-like [Metopolophium dirhodum]